MERRQFEDWLRGIYETQDEEIDCTECFHLVSGFVEIEASGGDAAAKMPQVEQHLGQCRACHDEYETLREIRRLEDHGAMPSLDDLQGLIR